MQNEWVLGSITKNEANGGPMGSGVLKRKKESELGLRVFFFFFNSISCFIPPQLWVYLNSGGKDACVFNSSSVQTIFLKCGYLFFCS